MWYKGFGRQSISCRRTIFQCIVMSDRGKKHQTNTDGAFCFFAEKCRRYKLSELCCRSFIFLVKHCVGRLLGLDPSLLFETRMGDSKSSYCKTLTISEMMQVGRLTESLPHSGAKSDEAPCGAIRSSKTLQVFGTPPVFCPPSPASRHNSYYGRSAPTTTSKLQRLLTLVSRRPNLP